MSVNYRKILYTNYHTTQSGRASGTDAATLFNREKAQFAREIVPCIPTDNQARIFDFGCGSGSLLSALKDAGYQQISGMDISEEQVMVAHKLGVKEVELGDALAYIRHTEQAFDVVTGMDIIEHFTKDELVDLLQAVRRSLRPGGVAIFRTPNLDALMSSVFANGDFTHENYMNGSSARQVCMACGFSQVQVFPSLMRIDNPVKELIRKALWKVWNLRIRLLLFATARSSRGVLFSPNMIIVARN